MTEKNRIDSKKRVAKKPLSEEVTATGRNLRVLGENRL